MVSVTSSAGSFGRTLESPSPKLGRAGTRPALRRVGVEVGYIGPAKAGVARYFWNLLQELVRANTDTEFLLYSAWPVEIPLHAAGNWRPRVERGIRGMPFELWIQHTLPGMLAEDDLDVFWGQGFVVPPRAPSRCARILTLYDLTPVMFPHLMARRARLSYSWLLRSAVRSADAVVTISAATSRLAHLLLGVPQAKMSVVYPGADPGLRPPNRPEARAVAASRFGLTGDFLLCVGTLEPRKDHLTLFSAFDMLGQSPLLVLAGAEGWRCAEIVAEVQVRERRGAVKYLGRVTDHELAALYAAARLMVYPSVYEGFGLPVLEAMACGCPVVCSWSSSLPEVGGSAVAYFRPRDAADLAAKLAELLANKDDLDRMAADGRVQAARFSFRSAAQGMLRVMREGVPEQGPASTRAVT